MMSKILLIESIKMNKLQNWIREEDFGKKIDAMSSDYEPIDGLIER